MFRRSKGFLSFVAILGCAVFQGWHPEAAADTVYVLSRSSQKLVSFDTKAPGTITTLSSSINSNSAGLAMGSDGNLYLGDAGDGDTVDPSIRRFTLASGSLSTVATLDPYTQYLPTAIAFRPASQGGDMVVGHYGPGPVLKVSGWNTDTATVSNYTTSLDTSLGLAVGADGSLYVSNDVVTPLGGGYVSIAGPIVRFDSTGGNPTNVAVNNAPSGLSGPTALLLEGSTLYSASIMNGGIFATDLTNANTSTNTSLFASAGNPFEVGPMARLSDGSLLVGGVSGYGYIYRFSSGGTLLGTFSDASFGQVGGIVTAVPEPGTIVLVAAGIAVVVGANRLRRLRNAGR